MYRIEELHTIIEKKLAEQNFIQKPIELYEPLDYTLNQGGKRMRPLLVLMACDLFGGQIEQAIMPALGIEVFHNFTLIHDDIMDQAPLRRGKETVYKKWNTNIAILSGDAMFIKAYEYMLTLDCSSLPDVLKLFNTTAIEVCEGQQYDMNFETKADVTIPDYIEMIRLKTAVLIAASLKIGALIANTSKLNADLVYTFGENIGLAFQLKDDILDVFGDFDKFGKQTGTDIVTNKKTYLYLKAFELADTKKTEALEKAYAIENPQQKIDQVKKLYIELDVKSEAEKVMQMYYKEAIKILQKIDLAEDKKQTLLSIAEQLMIRVS